MIDKLLSQKSVHIAGLVFLWAIYAAIGVLIGFIVKEYLGFATELSIVCGAAAALLVAGVSEFLDRKFGWSKPAEKKGKRVAVSTAPKAVDSKESKPKGKRAAKAKELLSPAEFLDTTKPAGERSAIREYVALGGNADELRAELARRKQEPVL